ncbi:MAG: hypothetical protein JO139_08215 [Alphaproteobacteria bacterium]|nr:hypothetical protein [Alphaproteobacteria bacterium]
MSERQGVQGPWRVEADTLPEMAYDHYRHTLIHETSSIKAYLAPKHQERTILVAPKGYGKTLLLIAKKKSFLEARSGQIVMAENRFIDRPLGIFPVIKRELLDLLSSDYEFWKSLWKISLSLSAIKAFARATRERPADRNLLSHDWYARIITDDHKYFEAGEIFTDLLSQDYKYIFNIIARSAVIFPYFNRINTQVVFFIDNVDEYFRPVLEDRSAGANSRHSLYRNRSNAVWSLAQIALASVAYELEKTNHHIKIYCTIRHEAFLKMPEFEGDAFQISGRCTKIEYTRDDLEKIFLKNIDITPRDRLVDPDNADAMARLVGNANTTVDHRFVSRPEPVFDYFLRHTLYRPRDLMFIGGEIVKINPGERSAPAIRDAVNTATKTIVDSIFGEMRPFFAVPNRDLLFRRIETNVLALDQIHEVSEAYLADLGAAHYPNGEAGQPFSVLHKLGLLGTVRLEFANEGRWRQHFLQPTEIQINNDHELPVSEHFLIHPALDQSIYEKSAGKFIRGYDTRNIIGNELEWQEPLAYSFVLKGDMVGYSQVMNSELYEVVTRKLYEWTREICRDLMYVDVSGGDSILMIDGSAQRILRCAKELVRRAGGFQERPMQMRFGGAAGPIAFERMRRMHNGSWDAITVPMGLALRTSALIEPHAPPGSVVIEDRFHEFGRRRDAGFDPELSRSDLQQVDYDREDEKFILRKNPLDPPYRTKLWRINLD